MVRNCKFQDILGSLLKKNCAVKANHAGQHSCFLIRRDLLYSNSLLQMQVELLTPWNFGPTTDIPQKYKQTIIEVRHAAITGFSMITVRKINQKSAQRHIL